MQQNKEEITQSTLTSSKKVGNFNVQDIPCPNIRSSKKFWQSFGGKYSMSVEWENGSTTIFEFDYNYKIKQAGNKILLIGEDSEKGDYYVCEDYSKSPIFKKLELTIPENFANPHEGGYSDWPKADFKLSQKWDILVYVNMTPANAEEIENSKLFINWKEYSYKHENKEPLFVEGCSYKNENKELPSFMKSDSVVLLKDGKIYSFDGKILQIFQINENEKNITLSETRDKVTDLDIDNGILYFFNKLDIHEGDKDKIEDLEIWLEWLINGSSNFKRMWWVLHGVNALGSGIFKISWSEEEDVVDIYNNPQLKWNIKDYSITGNNLLFTTDNWKLILADLSWNNQEQVITNIEGIYKFAVDEDGNIAYINDRKLFINWFEYGEIYKDAFSHIGEVYSEKYSFKEFSIKNGVVKINCSITPNGDESNKEQFYQEISLNPEMPEVKEYEASRTKEKGEKEMLWLLEKEGIVTPQQIVELLNQKDELQGLKQQLQKLLLERSQLQGDEKRNFEREVILWWNQSS